MCERFSFFVALKEITTLYNVTNSELMIIPRFNIAPGSHVPIIADFEGKRVVLANWGAICDKERKSDDEMINVKAESIPTKLYLKKLLKNNRCLIPASGFYVWKNKDKNANPYFISKRDGRPFVFAGFYDALQSLQKPDLLFCTIITTKANKLFLPINNRMPVILDPLQAGVWLNKKTSQEKFEAILASYDPTKLVLYQVSKLCNNMLDDTPNCIKPA